MAEAVELLAGRGDALVLAGGTDVVCFLKDGVLAPDVVVDIKGIGGLNGISYNGDELKIGALVTFSDILHSPIVYKEFPVFHEMAGTVASVAIRNRATLVGNMCSAVPCLDSGPMSVLFDAVVHVTGPVGQRKIPITQWFKGPRETDLKKGELVTYVAFPKPASIHGGCFVKLGRYKGEDLAQASVAVMVLPDHGYRVSFGSVAPVPVRAPKIEALLEGKPLEDGLVEKALELVSEEIAPITDIRASKEYRLHMCRVMLERALKAAAQRLEGGGPKYGTQLI